MRCLRKIAVSPPENQMFPSSCALRVRLDLSFKMAPESGQNSLWFQSYSISKFPPPFSFFLFLFPFFPLLSPPLGPHKIPSAYRGVIDALCVLLDAFPVSLCGFLQVFQCVKSTKDA